MRKSTKVFVGDFETTVYEGQIDTQVWASAVVEIGTEDVKIFGSIDATFEFLFEQDFNIRLYYHNLKFDGSFWLSYLLKLGYKQAYTKLNDEGTLVDWLDKKDMPKNSFRYSISSKGQWYSIIIRTEKNNIIEIRDSLKLLPFSVKRIGKAFHTKHQKLEMKYEGFRYPNCPISDEEKEYIKNDVLVIKEALEITFKEGHDKLTIGACCLHEFKCLFDSKEMYESVFPDLSEIGIDHALYNAYTVDEYIRRSYKGGWCYVVKGKENQIFQGGITADVNSLYPSVMSSESGSYYPVGEPTFWKGNFIPKMIVNNTDYYYFIRVKTRFYLRKNKLPFIQVKNDYRYRGNECLESSDVWDKEQKRYVTHTRDSYTGELNDTRLVLTLTMVDFALFLEHYEVVEFEILDGCYFRTEIGIFDRYISKYRKIKETSEGAIRELAKLFLNNLYGKMASSTDSSFKIAHLDDDGILKFMTVTENAKKAGYIAVGSAITSYARNFTIRHAQKNFYGADKRGFIYADTDSIHCDLNADELVDIKVHPTNFCCWKMEASWDKGIFVRQKTYIEHVTAENLKPIVEPYYNVKCAGMSSHCKELFVKSILGFNEQDEEEQIKIRNGDYTRQELAFLKTHRALQDFKVGLTIPSMLKPRQIRGGVLLVSSNYCMR